MSQSNIPSEASSNFTSLSVTTLETAGAAGFGEGIMQWSGVHWIIEVFTKLVLSNPGVLGGGEYEKYNPEAESGVCGSMGHVWT